jgi:hypothetical protein
MGVLSAMSGHSNSFSAYLWMKENGYERHFKITT